MIDTHCHLTDPRLADQLDGVFARARAAGVTRVITIGTDLDDSRAAVALARSHAMVRCTVGVHPCHLSGMKGTVARVPPGESDLSSVLRELIARREVVAIGEIGFDKHWDRADATIATQRRFFELQLQIATETAMPVVLHSREAIDETLDVLANFPTVRAVFHSFTGTPEEAGRIADRGYTIGFTGPVTYKKNDALRAAAVACPIDQIVVETDGPYLAPEPVRNQRVNEPAFVAHVARRIAEARGMSYEAFDQATTRNAERFFDLV